jgi:galactose mutarotase-like enzyme
VAGLHRVARVEHEGFPAARLTSPAGVEATWVPTAGMPCASLRQRGAELLGLRRGLAAYAKTGSTMGIPLLHPWANRLARRGYALGEVRVDLPPGAPRVRDDASGLPIHGLLAGFPHFEVREATADRDAARLVAEADLTARPEIVAAFPFPHRLRVAATLREDELEVATSVIATGERAVPIAFGWHPYFRLPDLPRAAWRVRLPVRRRALLDERLLPTGRSEAVRVEPGPLGERAFDDLYVELEPQPCFVLEGGGRRLEVAFGPEYRFAIVYAPPREEFVCFEPMTAPTNPFEGGTQLACAPPGGSFTARFTVRVQ